MRTKHLYLFALALFALGSFYKYFLAPKPKLISNEEAIIHSSKADKTSVIPRREIKKTKVVKQKIELPKRKQQPKPQQEVLEKSFEDFYQENREPQDAQGNIYITQVTIVDNHILGHGDILLGTVQDLEKAQNDGTPLIIPQPTKWKNGMIPYEVDPGVDQNVKEIIEEVISDFNSRTNIKFQLRRLENDFLKFKNTSANCYTYIGKTGGEQPVYLSPRCAYKQVAHELMHTLGFYHEQSRLDRDEHIEVLWENIEEKFHSQFRKIKWEGIELENFPFDFESVMLYPSTAFSVDEESFTLLKRNGDPFLENQELSPQDISRINNLYPVEN